MYGDNTGELRDRLSELLSHRRIQHHIGAARRPTIPETTTVEERQHIGEQIARYRHGVLIWCHQGLTAAANPHTNVDTLTRRTRGPAEELRHRLRISLDADTASLPTIDELTTRQPFPMVDLWRHAARAAALGEHDFTAGVGHGRLSTAQSLALVLDAAEITRAVLALDRRYANIPGWHQVRQPRRLTLAAEACASYSRYRDLDYSIDQRGWTPPAHLIGGPGLAGIAGVLQAQHNLRLHLNTIPDAHSLRVIIDSQRLLSLHTARQLAHSDPEKAGRWEHRGQVYGKLVCHTRDLAGTIGRGGPAAGQAALAAGRAQHLPDNALADPSQAMRLARLSAGIDQRVSDALVYGITERLYHQRVNVLGLDERDGAMVHVIKQRYQPVTEPLRTDLLDIANNQLRPRPAQPSTLVDAAQNRLDFRTAIDHRRGGNHGETLAT